MKLAILLAALSITPALAAPVIQTSGIVNAAGYQAKLAPNAVFVIFGSGLGPTAISTATAPNYPAILAGTSISLTPAKGGASIAARMVYTLAGQVAGVVPSSVVPGDYAVTVTYNSQSSAPQTVTVAARSFGVSTVNSAGNGAAQVTIGNVNGGISLVRFTSGRVAFNSLDWTLTPAHPGDTIVIWGTGGGADSANDTGGTSGDQTSAGNIKVVAGGREITPLYAGTSSGYPGLWQINFRLPSDIAADCFAPLSVTAGGESSNWTTIAIAAPGQSACSDSQLNADALARLDAGGTVTGGGFGFIKATATNSFVQPNGTRTPTVTATVEGVSGGISRYSAAAIAETRSGIHIDQCTVYQKTAFQPRIGIGLPDGFLDAGASLPISGPGLPANAALTQLTGPLYALSLPAGTLRTGRYTVSGPGGADIAPFTRSIDVPVDFVATNFDSITSIPRAKALPITWTGGGSGYVSISGVFWSTVSGSSSTPAAWLIQSMTFYCSVPANQGSYTVLAAIFAYLPPQSADLTTGNYSYLTVNATSAPLLSTPFAKTGGGQTDWGSITYAVGVTKNIPVNPQ